MSFRRAWAPRLKIVTRGHSAWNVFTMYGATGAFGSAFTLYGIVLLFGAAGTSRIEALARPGLSGSPAVAFGLLLLLVGFGFKMSLAPFHAWAPDVYQGMPTPAVLYLSVAPKGASVLVLYRVFAEVFAAGLPDRFLEPVRILAAVAELQRIDRLHFAADLVAPFCVEQQVEAPACADPHVVRALRANVQVCVEIGRIQYRVAGRALAPQAFRHRAGAPLGLDP